MGPVKDPTMVIYICLKIICIRWEYVQNQTNRRKLNLKKITIKK